jgi:hypothetical protein
MKKLLLWQKRLFYLLLFLLPTNLAYHLIRPSAYVSGILVDYLIPTFYLTDIVIFLLLCLWLREIILHKKTQQRWFHSYTCSSKSPSVIFLALLLPSLIFSQFPLPAIYKWLKYLEFSLLALWLKQHFRVKYQFRALVTWLSAGVLFQSLLSLTQWSKQSSVFGYWFLGEQPYNRTTPGLDKITWFNGSLKLPPLGTFTHPNVLAGFLAVCLPLILYRFFKTRSKTNKIFYLVTAILALITLFLTFSLSAWLALLLIGLPGLIVILPSALPPRQRSEQLTLLRDLPRFQSWQQVLAQPSAPSPPSAGASKFAKNTVLKLLLFYVALLIILLSLSSRLSFLAPTSSFSRRSQLAKIALEMIRYRPLTGIGLNNFTPIMEKYGYVSASTRFLQPVHNVFLLILAETGLLGLLGFLYLLIQPFLKPHPRRSSRLLFTAYFSLLFLGLFDHYPLTLQPGSLLLFILLGLML